MEESVTASGDGGEATEAMEEGAVRQNDDLSDAKMMKRVERFGRIAPVSKEETEEKMAKRRAKFGPTEQVIELDEGALVFVSRQ